MKFRFKEFRVYQDAKEYCLFCRNITSTCIQNVDEELNQKIENNAHDLVKQLAAFRNKLRS
jgi:hypothetical protein